MKMKIGLLAMVFVCATVVNAQDKSNEERAKMLKGVLTDEQYKKYKEQKAENRKEMKKRMKE
jgi:hypothetical protein